MEHTVNNLCLVCMSAAFLLRVQRIQRYGQEIRFNLMAIAVIRSASARCRSSGHAARTAGGGGTEKGEMSRLYVLLYLFVVYSSHALIPLMVTASRRHHRRAGRTRPKQPRRQQHSRHTDTARRRDRQRTRRAGPARSPAARFVSDTAERGGQAPDVARREHSTQTQLCAVCGAGAATAGGQGRAVAAAGASQGRRLIMTTLSLAHICCVMYGADGRSAQRDRHDLPWLSTEQCE